VSSKATIASAATNAARAVSPATETARVTDTRTPTLTGPDGASPASAMGSELDAPAVRTPSPRWRWAAIPVAAVALTVLVVLPVLSIVPSSVVADKRNERLDVDQPAPYARIPGAAQPVDERITFGDLGDVARQYPPTGDIYFVTVSEPSQSVLSWLVGRDSPAIQFLTEEDKYGFQSPEQRRTAALQQMRTAEQVAQYVALQRVGYDVELVPGDVLIQDMVCLVANEDGTECLEWSPSDEVLDPGDKIVSVEGQALAGVEDLTQILVGLAPGDVVAMQIERPDVGVLDVEVELTASPEEPDRTIVGFYPFDTRQVVLPFELNIDTGSIGGPSAGLAFTLTLIDELTPGELTGGRSVAVTGTINLDGTVGAIGGLRQKASAVAQVGVDTFIVPASQGQDDIAAAREAAGRDLEVIPVATLDEAIAALVELGGDPLPE